MKINGDSSPFSQERIIFEHSNKKKMETINNELVAWLQQMGVTGEYAQWVMRVVVILGILLIVYVFDKICRRAIIPTIRKVTAKTQVTWDDYLLNDKVLDNVCHLIPPVVFYVLIPLAIPANSGLLEFVFKVCDIYITIVVVKLFCAFITSLYSISSEHEKLKDRSLKGFYQMLKLVVICIGAIVIVATLVDQSPVAILTGLGAGAAILMLVFQDTIKGLVSIKPRFLQKALANIIVKSMKHTNIGMPTRPRDSRASAPTIANMVPSFVQLKRDWN